MFSLPNNLPSPVKEGFESRIVRTSFEKTLINFSTLSLRLFQAEVSLLMFERKLGRDWSLEVSSTHVMRAGKATRYRDELIEKWQELEIHDAIKTELRQRLAPVSYSAFSWPFEAFELSSQRGQSFSVPSEFTLFVPFCSELTVRLSESEPFFGYFALFFRNFPAHLDELVELVINVPKTVSDISGAYLYHAED